MGRRFPAGPLARRRVPRTAAALVVLLLLLPLLVAWADSLEGLRRYAGSTRHPRAGNPLTASRR